MGCDKGGGGGGGASPARTSTYSSGGGSSYHPTPLSSPPSPPPAPPQKVPSSGGGRSDYTRGQEIVRGTNQVGHDRTPIVARVSKGDKGVIHAVKGGPFGKSHTTAHPDGSFHHHGEHVKGRDNPFSNKGKNAILSLWRIFSRKS